MRSFHILSWVTLIAVYVLILIGGIVRSTGAGMGCPDWPKCFGSWVPPTTVDDLPGDYKEIYSAHRSKKNQRFAQYLSLLGFEKTAHKILEDKSILEEADFNATKTWIEYFNRIVGVVIGLLIIGVAFRSIKFRKTDGTLTWISFAALILVIFQGWIGSIVVSTNLTPWTITLHMLLAMLLVVLLVALVVRSLTREREEVMPRLKLVQVLCLILLLLQIVYGTEVREAIDRLTQLSRSQWIDSLGMEFIRHRSFSWIILISHAFLLRVLFKTQLPRNILLVLIVLIICTILTGTMMAYAGVPPVLQPIHLLLATATFGLQVMLFFRLKGKKLMTI